MNSPFKILLAWYVSVKTANIKGIVGHVGKYPHFLCCQKLDIQLPARRCIVNLACRQKTRRKSLFGSGNIRKVSSNSVNKSIKVSNHFFKGWDQCIFLSHNNYQGNANVKSPAWKKIATMFNKLCLLWGKQWINTTKLSFYKAAYFHIWPFPGIYLSWHTIYSFVDSKAFRLNIIFNWHLSARENVSLWKQKHAPSTQEFQFTCLCKITSFTSYICSEPHNKEQLIILLFLESKVGFLSWPSN